MSRSLKVLALQPYFGGSHAQFHRGWLAHSTHHWTTLELPARHWKWRMRHAAIHFSEQIHQLADEGARWDVIVATDMMNIAELKGLLRADLRGIPIVLYFHENQFVYPNQFGQERDRHFPFTNFISAIAADEIWFNSQFNLDSLIAELKKASKRWPDFKPTTAIDALIAKSHVQPPGIETPPLNMADVQAARVKRATAGEPIRIVWAARWEHDKNPDRLFEALKMLDEESVPFRLSVIGQSFRKVPPVFEEIQTRFEDRIVRWGYQESRAEYWAALAESDVFVSTAAHEFFGLSAAEAIAVGTRPLLPNRLAYPELLGYAIDDSTQFETADSDQNAANESSPDGSSLLLMNYLYDDELKKGDQSAAEHDGLVLAIKAIAGERESQMAEVNFERSQALSKRLLSRLANPVRGGELDRALVEVVGPRQ